MPANKPPVSVLGLGMMGTALAAAFLKAGHPVTVWNRSPAKTGPLVAQGALPAKTAAEAVAESPLVVFCLLTNDNVEEVFATLPEAVAGKTLVNLTNGTPAQARDLAAWAAKHGAHYIDGGIMAVPQMIAGPHAYVLYSGDEQAYETHRPTLAALGDTKWTGTDPGLAALHDLALLTGMYGMFMGVLQAFALVRTENNPSHRILRAPGPLDQRDALGRAGAGQGDRHGTAPDGCLQPRREPGRLPQPPEHLPRPGSQHGILRAAPGDHGPRDRAGLRGRWLVPPRGPSQEVGPNSHHTILPGSLSPTPHLSASAATSNNPRPDSPSGSRTPGSPSPLSCTSTRRSPSPVQP